MAQSQRDRVIRAWLSVNNETNRVIAANPRPQESWLQALYRLLPEIPVAMHDEIDAAWAQFLDALTTNDFSAYTNQVANRIENACQWAVDQLRLKYPPA